MCWISISNAQEIETGRTGYGELTCKIYISNDSILHIRKERCEYATYIGCNPVDKPLFLYFLKTVVVSL